MTLTPEQIADGWKLPTSDQHGAPAGSLVEIVTGNGWDEILRAEDCDLSCNESPTNDPEGYALNHVTMYRTYSPDRPQAEPVAWRYRYKEPNGTMTPWWIVGNRGSISHALAQEIEPLFTRPSTPVLEWDKEDDSVLNLNGLCIAQVIQSQKGGNVWYPELLGQYRGEPFTDYEAARSRLLSRAKAWIGET